jgi:Ca-activated chloride channel family protein
VADLAPANLVFLVDVSGSMDRREGLPLVKSTLKVLVDQLRDQDRVSLVGNA